jgi:1,4-dihydroxy-2-naphthoyl-CoA synthase
LHSHKHFQLDVVGKNLVALLAQSTLQNAAVTVLRPYSAVIKRYKIVTAVLHGLGRHRFVKDIAVIVLTVLRVGSQAFAGMDKYVTAETKFYVGTPKVTL